jgi:HlyD family secretion protein
MKKKRTIVILCIIVAVAVGGVLVRHVVSARNAGTFQLGDVTKGDIVNTVSSTGTLSAVNSVNVGAQVSGTIDKLYADFNDTVHAGQVLAVLDTTILAAQVFDARAGMLRSKSQLDQAQAEYERNKPLYDNGFLSATEILTFKTSYDAALAAYRSTDAVLKRAVTNLHYATIKSPIDGTVIERSVDAGQTIQASFQAPTLFIIASDLTSMQIEVNVDESDIGVIKEGQEVQFTVQAYPDEKFKGKVRQVRLQPTTIQNVVNYTVVVDASNESGKLLPGMTATVDFIVNEKKDIVLVPNSAIQFKPDQALVEKAMKEFRKEMAVRRSRGDSTSAGAQWGGSRGARQGAVGGRQGGFAFGGGRGPSGGAGAPSRVFYIDKNGEPAVAFFMPGVTDGRNTEVKESRTITEGMKVITGVTVAQKTSNTTVTPFGFPGGPPQGGRGMRRIGV